MLPTSIQERGALALSALCSTHQCPLKWKLSEGLEDGDQSHSKTIVVKGILLISVALLVATYREQTEQTGMKHACTVFSCLLSRPRTIKN